MISRNSTFVYKGQSVNLREIAQKLGAQYLVEGSVRKSGGQLRVTAQLIDTASDTHIWAERYDRKLDDVFAIQDELTAAIVATLPGRLEAAQQDLVARKTPASMAAYECVLAAKVRHHRGNRAENEEALKLITRAVELDPDTRMPTPGRAASSGKPGATAGVSTRTRPSTRLSARWSRHRRWTPTMQTSNESWRQSTSAATT
ncbi:hypothetical protein AJ88_44720 [Mesorhizobium amorphae CCBAU 01583]|nr:hypothetical protein AJ88_44720 [Mesorhizobium amorphae CCBAU 01583]